MFAQAAIGLVGQVIGIFGDRAKGKQEALKTFATNMQRTWVDEVIALYWFGPSFISWFGYVEPLNQQVAMINSGSFLFETQLGITAAVFGLGKLAGKR